MQRLHLFEIFLYAIILAIAMSIPFFTGDYTNFGWGIVFDRWLRLLPFVFVFAANNFIFVPKLFFREKYAYYFLACMLSVIVVFLSIFFFVKMPPPGMVPPSGNMSPYVEGMTPPSGNRLPPHLSPGGFGAGKQRRLHFNYGSTIIAILLIGFNTGIKSFVRWSEEKVRQAEKERQYFYTELAYLKHQISPHFFMNTLNNIHALVDINREEAKNAIIKLSHLMRYMLYESNVQKVALMKEIDFIESYIELIRLRYDEDNLTIKTDYPDIAETVYVPSFLFLSFIENAFKHGIHPNDHSTIIILFSIETGRLKFCITNNRWKVATHQTETAGIGLENVRKRLDLIYRDDYTLDIHSSDNVYEVILTIPIT
jgi:hypothetical protein